MFCRMADVLLFLRLSGAIFGLFGSKAFVFKLFDELGMREVHVFEVGFCTRYGLSVPVCFTAVSAMLCLFFRKALVFELLNEAREGKCQGL